MSQQRSLGPVGDDTPVVLSRCEVVGERRLGDVGALIAVAEELGVLAAFDNHAPGTRSTPSLGEMILGVALQRVCAPGGKSELSAFLGDCVPLFSLMKPKLFTGQGFHRVTRGVSDEVYEAVQREIAAKAVDVFGLSTDVLAYDTTNFDTFLATDADAELAQRGKAKSKRSDLKVVGMVMMTSATDSVPLFHRTYPGNANDKKVLAATLDTLASFHDELGEAERTLVRDGGFFSEQLELDLDQGRYHSITSLPLGTTLAKSALSSAVGKLEPLPGSLYQIRVHRLRQPLGEMDRTLLVVDSPELLKGQLRGLEKDRAYARGELSRWTARLELQRAGKARGRHLTVASLKKKATGLLCRSWLSEFLSVTVDAGADGQPTLHYVDDQQLYENLVDQRLGKRVLITDQHDWSSESIVKAFRSQWHVERAFRRMKRGKVSPWGTSYVWSDDSIRAHSFATVLGLQLATLTTLKMRRAGQEGSVKASIERLAKIKLTVMREKRGKSGRPRDLAVPHTMDKDQRKLVELFDLARWSPLLSTTARSG